MSDLAGRLRQVQIVLHQEAREPLAFLSGIAPDWLTILSIARRLSARIVLTAYDPTIWSITAGVPLPYRAPGWRTGGCQKVRAGVHRPGTNRTSRFICLIARFRIAPERRADGCGAPRRMSASRPTS